MRRSMARGLAALAIAFGTVPAGSGTANAAISDGAAVSACGSSYYVQRKATIGWGQDVTVFLLYSASTKLNCVVTMKHPDMGWVYGAATALSAGIQAEGGSWKTDPGDYKYYAGPVYLSAPGKCVRFSAYYEEYGAGYSHDINCTSPWGSCG
ncbi:serine/threonine protein kinase [Streptomyces filamentosus]|uniref:serine/threonine protein kinase n=1 Tax=Streptomyces filamentosus TaxID=67294 RepID=UPI00123B7050|nr:serine/threonine protein kinase [Streptomyces filamentosus]KAA6216665.1 serine/threonine protein kinase [Streptomyces filamentosus]